MTDPKDMATLAVKIAQVAGAIGAIEKSGWNDYHKYEYYSEGDITAALRGHLAEAKLALLWSHKVVDTSEGKDARGKLVRRVRVEGELILVCGDTGAMLTVKSAGEGEDGGDKAVYKANTGAFKYALMKTFLLSDAESDPERSTVDGERTGAKGRGKQAARKQKRTQAPSRRPEQRKPQQRQPTDEERRARANKRFEALTVLAKLTKDEARELRLGYCLDFEVERWSEIPVGKLEAMIAKMEKADEQMLSKRFRARVAGAA